MSKCRSTSQFIRAMAHPENPENAAILAHLYACDDCMRQVKELLEEDFDQVEYTPMPGDDEAAADVVGRVLQQKTAWQRLFNRCKAFLDYIGAEFSTSPQPMFAGARRRSSQVRTIVESPVFNFKARPNEPRYYQWSAVMTLPKSATDSAGVVLTFTFPSLAEDAQPPQKVCLHGKELSIENGVAHISCKELGTALKGGDGEIYVVFDECDGLPYRSNGDLIL